MVPQPQNFLIFLWHRYSITIQSDYYDSGHTDWLKSVHRLTVKNWLVKINNCFGCEQHEMVILTND